MDAQPENMSGGTKGTAISSLPQLCKLAAWFSLLIPIGMIAIGLINRGSLPDDKRALTHELGEITVIFVCSLFSGIMSLAGWRYHRGNSTRWVAVFGILASAALAAFAAFSWVFMDAMMHARNC
jgi:glucan phosphoethanolaminetransferase (alkaline phosphatase superfamily)